MFYDKSIMERRMIKMWCTYSIEYYSAINKNEIVSFTEMWMDPDTVIQSEKQRKYCILMHIYGI